MSFSCPKNSTLTRISNRISELLSPIVRLSFVWAHYPRTNFLRPPSVQYSRVRKEPYAVYDSFRSGSHAPLRFFFAIVDRSCNLLPHRLLYLVGRSRQTVAQQHQLAVLAHGEDIFNADAQLFFRNVNPRLQCEDHAFIHRHAVVAGIMDVQSHVMSQPVDEIFAQRLAMEVFAMRVDVIERDFVERIRIGA